MSDKTTYVPFRKMHGLGNDFIVFDARALSIDLSAEQVVALSDRRRGIGCDQLIIMRQSERADVFMEIRNADGSRVGACGNATRCIGKLMITETGKATITIESDAGLLSAQAQDDLISVNMGEAKTSWQDIPLASAADTISVDINIKGLPTATCVNIGNPHAVFIMAEEITDHDLSYYGPMVESHPSFPERANASFATIKNDIIRLRVWERGAGVTEACGSAACASVVAATRLGLIERQATVRLDGGSLYIHWLDNNTVQMTGSATFVYEGKVLLP